MWKVFAFLFSFVLSGFLAVSGTAFADYSPRGKNWMRNLDDDLLITQITIPGTHDSAADLSHCDENPDCKAVHEFASTQTYDIRDQMDLGIRFFDVRLAYDEHNDRAFEFHHGPYDLKQSLYDAIEWAGDFLKENPTEFLIWLVKQEHTNADADAFWRDLSSDLADRDIEFYSKKKILTVGDARGKVIIMARNHSSEYPQGYHVEWPGNTVYYSDNDQDLFYCAEDHYSLNSVSDSTKLMDIKRNLTLARLCVADCGNPKTLFFTFLSGEADESGHGPSYFAQYENLKTAGWLTEEAALGPRSGIIAMDFAGDNGRYGDYMLDAAIGQNPPRKVPGWFGDNNDGGGITVTDINGNGKPDLVVLSIDDPDGANGGYYRIGWDLDDDGKTGNWSDPQSIPWQGNDQQGGGITATDMNKDGIPDLIVFMIDNPEGENSGYYRIGYMDNSGSVTQWTDFINIPGWFGTANNGGGITVTDINGNGEPDLIVLSIDNPAGTNAGYYRIGWDLDEDGKTGNWSGPQSIPWQGNDQAGGGITAADANGDGTPDIIVYMIDDPDGQNFGYYRIGYMDKNGSVTQWTDFERDFEWIGSSNGGGGITAHDIDQNGKLDLIVFTIYDPDGENTGYYRVLWDEGSK